MALYTFETITAPQAAAYQPSDSLAFSTGAANLLSVNARMEQPRRPTSEPAFRVVAASSTLTRDPLIPAPNARLSACWNRAR
jgi:hypothetical protein